VPSLKLTVIIFTNRDGHDRHLMHRSNALVSIFSDYKISMPLEIMMKKEIDNIGVQNGIETYDKLKADPKYAKDNTTITFLGFEYYRLQEYSTAKDLFVKATQEYPNHFGGYYSLAVVNRKLNNIEQAIVNFEKVIELGSADEPWMIDRARKQLEDIKDK